MGWRGPARQCVVLHSAGEGCTQWRKSLEAHLVQIKIGKNDDCLEDLVELVQAVNLYHGLPPLLCLNREEFQMTNQTDEAIENLSPRLNVSIDRLVKANMRAKASLLQVLENDKSTN